MKIIDRLKTLEKLLHQHMASPSHAVEIEPEPVHGIEETDMEPKEVCHAVFTVNVISHPLTELERERMIARVVSTLYNTIKNDPARTRTKSIISACRITSPTFRSSLKDRAQAPTGTRLSSSRKLSCRILI